MNRKLLILKVLSSLLMVFLVTSVAYAQSDERVVVIVNSSIKPSIQPSLDQFKADLENEGYSVIVYATEGGTPEALRAYLRDKWDDDPEGLVGCILIGDLPVPWFEIDDDFGGGETATFPCDLFYMDLDGIWNDTDSNWKYDEFTDQSVETYHSPEIWVGRLTASPLDEEEDALLNNYFDKNHQYRTHTRTLNKRALLYIDDDWATGASGYKTNLENLYGDVTCISDMATTTGADYKARLTHNYDWIQVMVHSDPSLHHFYKEEGEVDAGYVFQSDIKSIDPDAFFYNLFACSNCRYVENNYMGGRYIFADTYGLMAVGTTKTGSMRYFGDFYQPAGQGKNLGDAFKEWFAARAPYDLEDRQWYYGMTLLGDPTLKADTPLPDAQVRSGATGYRGDGIYNTTGAQQAVSEQVLVNREIVYYVKIENDRGLDDTFRVIGTSGDSAVAVSYHDDLSGGTDITDQITGDGWPTASLAPGETREIRLEVAVNKLSTKEILITVISQTNAIAKDTVKAACHTYREFPSGSSGRAEGKDWKVRHNYNKCGGIGLEALVLIFILRLLKRRKPLGRT